jgi:hypothetical protein
MSTTAHMPALQSHLIVDVTDHKPCGALFGTPIALWSGASYQICEKPFRWNDTPYWAMQMPAAIVPDHGGFFNKNFVNLLFKFLPPSAELDNQMLRRTLRLKSPP